MEIYKICCITYKVLDRVVREALADFHDPQVAVEIVEGLREEIIDKVQEQVSHGAEVVVAGGANAQIARENIRVPVLDYGITAFDYLSAIDQGFSLGDHPAIVTYKTGISSQLGAYLQRVGIAVENIIYDGEEDLARKISQSKANVLIGAAYATEVAAACGMAGVLIHPSRESVWESVRAAATLAQDLRRLRANEQMMQMIMEHTTNGIFLTDADQIIVHSNQRLGGLLQREGAPLNGMPLGKVFPECGLDDFIGQGVAEDTRIIKVKGREILQNLARIEDGPQNFSGVAGIFSDVSEIQRAQVEYMERRQQEKREKGFVAKKHFEDMVGSSYALRSCIDEARLFAASSANVLLYGETGVGKEILAQGIHNDSTHRKGAFVAINCAALPETLLETELFGYDSGAFTGGRKGGRKGLFELADDGTLFLDEIGEITPAMQIKLLRVLQEREIMRVGGERVIPVNVRVISATNKNLEEAPETSFRRDLLYRLNVLELRLPPLRERGRDALELMEHLLKQKRGIETMHLKLSEETTELLLLYSWPGNIRELQNVCERFYLYMSQNKNTSDRYVKRCMIRAVGEDRLFRDIVSHLCPTKGEISPELVERLGRMFSYSREQLGERLGISRTTLWRMDKKRALP